jgi:hypothetical protein
MKLEIKRMRFALISVLLLCAMARQTGAATTTVTNTNDSGPGSLRQALAVAHDGNRITFTVSGVIRLTGGARSDQTEKFVVERFHPSGRAASKY